VKRPEQIREGAEVIALIRRRPVLAHFLLSLLIACMVMVNAMLMYAREPASAALLGDMVADVYAAGEYVNIVSIGRRAIDEPALSGILVFAVAPTLAALALAALGAGGGYRRLLARLRLVGPDRPAPRVIWMYGGVIVVYAMGFLLYDFIAGPGVQLPLFRLESLGGAVVAGALVGMIVDEGGTLEELGWRGFEWPLLRDRLSSPLAAALLLGSLHWAWHLPREIPALLTGAPLAPLLMGQAVFLGLTVALAIVAGFCVNVAGGSVWPAILVHGGSNAWSKSVGEVAESTFGLIDPRTLMLAVIAILIALLAGRRLGLARGDDPAANPGRSTASGA
jgi:hypothetical protein